MIDSLVRKYLDGELTEDESRCFLDAVEADPELGRKVRVLEELVDLGAGMEPAVPSAGFTDRVMTQVRARELPQGSGRLWRRLVLPALAASWILALGLGFFLSRELSGKPEGGGSVAITEATPGTASVAGLKMVRLVYSPQQPGVSSVRVAGSFNNWDPDRTPMHLENGRWVATLLLPPNSYEYMFVVDDDTWVTDPFALTTRDDGFGSRNAVLDLSI